MKFDGKNFVQPIIGKKKKEKQLKESKQKYYFHPQNLTEKLVKPGPGWCQVHCTQVCCRHFIICKFQRAAKYGFIVDLLISKSCFHDHTVLTWHAVQKMKMSEWVGEYWGTVFTFIAHEPEITDKFNTNHMYATVLFFFCCCCFFLSVIAKTN